MECLVAVVWALTQPICTAKTKVELGFEFEFICGAAILYLLSQ
jgi:hypothetical protein